MGTTKAFGNLESDFYLLKEKIHQLIQGHESDSFILTKLDEGDAYGDFIRQYNLSEAERIMLLVALAATYKPEVLVPFALYFNKAEVKSRYGGFIREETLSFYPTVRTALYVMAGNDEEKYHLYISYFSAKNKLFTSGILHLITMSDSKATVFFDQQIVFNDQFLPTVLNGTEPLLDTGAGFPAKRSKRTHSMKEVVLKEETQLQLEKLFLFARNMKKLWHLPESRLYRQNFISIFSGDPGTGKSHTAEALGNELGLPVYKVNFAQLVSKYIGETEKNLELIFDRFNGHPNILFFDEAEAIFSKRTEVKDSHDKHSNNEQSYLLQKIEEYNGIIILATNVHDLAQYFDKAFQRRIRQIVKFPFPDYEERLRLWKNALGESFQYEEGLADKLAKNYQLSGGGIYNVISEAVINALDTNTRIITFDLVEQAMKDEFKKTERQFMVCPDEMLSKNAAWRYGTGYELRKNF